MARLIDINDIPSEILDGIVKNEKLDLPNTHITVRTILEMQDTVDAIPRAQIDEMVKEIEQLERFELRGETTPLVNVNKVIEIIHKYTDKEQ